MTSVSKETGAAILKRLNFLYGQHAADLLTKIEQLLEKTVNPMLASHGGFATLIGVDTHTAYVTMGGGCQGCSMSQATLTEGIQRAIVEAVPEITDVVDATDHSAGDNPFYS